MVASNVITVRKNIIQNMRECSLFVKFFGLPIFSAFHLLRLSDHMIKDHGDDSIKQDLRKYKRNSAMTAGGSSVIKLQNMDQEEDT